jgi:LuxR family maltose regulon positive regulatory protein
LARVALERYDLRAAREHVASAAACRALQGNRVARGMADSVIAGLERASGHLVPALERLVAAGAAAADSDPWLADYLRAEAARLEVASGSAAQALEGLETLEAYDGSEAALVAAAAYAEQGQEAAVDRSLARAGTAEPTLQAQVSRLLVELVQESRHRPSGRTRVVLDRSLRLAAPEELRRPFREAGPTVQRLMSADSRLLNEHQWLSAPTTDKTPTVPAQRGPQSQRAVPGARSAEPGPEVVEALTAKEREVLTHLEELLTTEEIAEKMFVSVNTVRTHIRSILRKLGVNRRNAAVRKARELGLVNG